MSTNTDPDEVEQGSEGPRDAALPPAVASTETYQTEDGTVFYDADQPTAWLEIDEPVNLEDNL